MAGQTTNYLFDYPTSTDYVKDGATAIQTLATDVDTTLFTALGGDYPGLRLIKKQTIGSAVSSVVVTGAFSSTYENYKIVISGGTCSVGTDLTLRLGSGTAHAGALIYASFATGVVGGAGYSSQNSLAYAGRAETDGLMMDIDVLSPNLAKWSRITNPWLSTVNAGTLTGGEFSTTQFTAFTVGAGAATLTGGTIYVYGYGAS